LYDLLFNKYNVKIACELATFVIFVKNNPHYPNNTNLQSLSKKESQENDEDRIKETPGKNKLTVKGK